MSNEKINNKNSGWLKGNKSAPIVDHPEIDEMFNLMKLKSHNQ